MLTLRLISGSNKTSAQMQHPWQTNSERASGGEICIQEPDLSKMPYLSAIRVEFDFEFETLIILIVRCL